MAIGRHTIVSSFSAKGYEAYGRDFLHSFREFFPASVKLHCYIERPVTQYTDEALAPGRWSWSLIEEVEGWPAYEKAVSTFPLMRGEGPKGYTIQYDALMARKVFIQAHGVKQFGGKVFWVDADTIVHSPVPETFLDEVLPDDKLCCYLGRDGWMYTESGFLGFNADHPACETFIQGYLNIFRNGYNFTQSQWHDCIGFDMVRRVLDPEPFHNLSEGLPHGTMHPFINSVLGTYMDHRKGGRKDTRSGVDDLVIERTEPYWTGGNEIIQAQG